MMTLRHVRPLPMDQPISDTDVARTLHELLNETERQREMIAGLLGQLGEEANRKLRASQREPFDLELHFVNQTDIVRARGLDISDGGMGVEIESPMPFLLRTKENGETKVRQVELMWSKITSSGSQRLGFRFRQ